VLSDALMQLSLVNSGVAGPKLTNFLSDIDGSTPLLTRLLTLPSPNQFRDAGAKNEGGTGEFFRFGNKIGCHVNVP